jgi:hypothetical protein
MAKDFYSVTGTIVTAPPSAVSTATAALNNTSKQIIGTNMNVLKKGDWIVDLVNKQRRMVISVDSPTQVTVSHPFTTAVASGALNVVSNDAAAVYMLLSASGDIDVDGVTCSTAEFGNLNNSGSTTKLIKPRFITAGAETCIVNIEFFNNTYAD